MMHETATRVMGLLAPATAEFFGLTLPGACELPGSVTLTGKVWLTVAVSLIDRTLGSGTISLVLFGVEASRWAS